VREISGVTDTLYQCAADNNPESGGGFKAVVVGSLGHILKSTRSGSFSSTWSIVHTAAVPLRACAYGDGKWIAAGDDDVVLTSSNGTSWTAITTGLGGSWNWATWGGGKFVMVGDLGVVAYSTNGTSWTQITTDSDADMHSVVYSDSLNKFTAVGDGGIIVVSEG
jgi:hypothetical protein